MSVNLNLSKLALNVNANGDVKDAGLAITYSSNNYVRSRFDNGDGGRLASNNYITSSFPSNTYVTSTFTSNNYVDGRFTSNSYVGDTFSSNAYSSNATNLTSGTIPSGRLTGTYSISISGSADRVDGKNATDFISNTYGIATYTSNNYLNNGMSVAANGDVTFTSEITTTGRITGATTDTLLIKDSAGSTVKTIRGV